MFKKKKIIRKFLLFFTIHFSEAIIGCLARFLELTKKKTANDSYICINKNKVSSGPENPGINREFNLEKYEKCQEFVSRSGKFMIISLN